MIREIGAHAVYSQIGGGDDESSLGCCQFVGVLQVLSSLLSLCVAFLPNVKKIISEKKNKIPVNVTDVSFF